MGNNIIPWNTFWLVWKRLEKMLSCQKLKVLPSLTRPYQSLPAFTLGLGNISQIYTALLSVSHFHEEQSHLITEALCASEINLQLHSSHRPLVYHSVTTAWSSWQHLFVHNKKVGIIWSNRCSFSCLPPPVTGAQAFLVKTFPGCHCTFPCAR